MIRNFFLKIKPFLTRLSWLRNGLYTQFKRSLKEEDLNYLNKAEIKEAEDYWRKYTNKYEVKYCSYYSSVSGSFDKRYITDYLYYSYIDKHFNNVKKANGIDDKNYYDNLFPNLKQPRTILRKMNNHYYDYDYNLLKPQDVKNIINKEKRYILKPSTESNGGKGIIFVDNLNTKKFDDLLSSDNFIIQKQVGQHKMLKDLHPSSLNTFRIISLFFKGKVYILSSLLRIGISGSRVDNVSKGGIVVGINENGKLKKEAYSSNERKTYTQHPDTKIIFEGYKIPKHKEILDIIKKEAIKFPNFRMVSWDFSVDENEEIIFIELNLYSGQLDIHQFTNGPLFGELTEEVLAEVFV